jgi:hypothetical protein
LEREDGGRKRGEGKEGEERQDLRRTSKTMRPAKRDPILMSMYTCTPLLPLLLPLLLVLLEGMASYNSWAGGVMMRMIRRGVEGAKEGGAAPA